MASRPQRAVLTLVSRNPAYMRWALNLAQSFFLWHPGSDIDFWIATDLDVDLPPDLTRVSVLKLAPDELPSGFSAKLHIDRLAPADRTLFVDADCLCFGSLAGAFERFAGRPVSVVGSLVSSGEWFGDIETLLKRFNLKQLPRFNGGLYYVEPSEASARVYQTARELEGRYTELGLIPLRGGPNEELLVALSMALHGMTPLPDDGTIMGDLFSCPAGLRASVVTGRTRMVNPRPPHPDHRSWYPHHVIHPVLVHFLGDTTDRWRYRAEEKKLRLISQHQWPGVLTEAVVRLGYGVPQQIVEAGKTLARPVYHSLFGPRPIARSVRMP